jgi:hypothetical protein
MGQIFNSSTPYCFAYRTREMTIIGIEKGTHTAIPSSLHTNSPIIILSKINDGLIFNRVFILGLRVRRCRVTIGNLILGIPVFRACFIRSGDIVLLLFGGLALKNRNRVWPRRNRTIVVVPFIFRSLVWLRGDRNIAGDCRGGGVDVSMMCRGGGVDVSMMCRGGGVDVSMMEMDGAIVYLDHRLMSEEHLL